MMSLDSKKADTLFRIESIINIDTKCDISSHSVDLDDSLVLIALRAGLDIVS